MRRQATMRVFGINGRAWLARFAFVMAGCLSILPQARLSARPISSAKPTPPASTQGAWKNAPKARSADTINKLADALARARTPSEARAIRAQADARRLDRLTPAVMALVRKGRDLQKANKVGAAEHMLSSALTLQPDQAILWRFRATIRAQGQDTPGAIADLGVALQRDPTDTATWRLLSELEKKAGNAFAEHRALQRLHARDPQSEVVTQRSDVPDALTPDTAL